MISLKEAVDLTGSLIAIPSINPGGDMNSIANFIRDWLEENGIDAKVVQVGNIPNVMAAVGPAGGKGILLNGNFDVVTPGDLSQWETDPFFPSCAGGLMVGRGCADMKSGIAAMMLAMRELKRREEELDGEVVFMAVGDGETNSMMCTQTLLSRAERDFDGAIVPEPTDFCIENAQRGLRWLEINIKGRACHAARPHLGLNAIEQAAKVITALKNIQFTQRNNMFELPMQKPSISINKIRGGVQNNIIADKCRLLVDRRMIPGEREADVVEEIQKTVMAALEDGFEARVSLIGHGWDPYMLKENEPLLRQAEKSFRKIMGKQPVVRGKGGCTDASHIFNAGIPVVIFGPGDPDDAHRAGERVRTERIPLAGDIIVDICLGFMKEKEITTLW